MILVDTDILLYAVSALSEDAEKRRRARSLLTEADLGVSVQVLQEFYHQATRPGRPARLTHDDALRFLEPIMRFPVQTVTMEVFRAALSIRQRFRLSYWDSAILAAARVLGCHSVYSEDMSDGQDYGGVRVIDPFAGLGTAVRPPTV